MGFIYLRTDPETCHKRMNKRNRSEEASVPLAYLQKLHDKHEEWLIEKKDVAPYLKNIPVLVLECDEDFEHNKKEQEKHIGRIVDFFNSIRMKAQKPRANDMLKENNY
jgi:deoxyadenosine/deoxycytidine kinase